MPDPLRQLRPRRGEWPEQSDHMHDDSGPDFSEDVDAAQVEAIGEPGQRRFRLIVGMGDRTVIVWMEKQQLEALGLAIQRMLGQLDAGDEDDDVRSIVAPLDLNTLHQFRGGRIEIGYNHERRRILIVAYDIESAEGDAPSLAGLFSRSLAEEMAEAAAEVVAAGRPRCVLCGMPMGPGPHACAEQNGHLIHYT